MVHPARLQRLKVSLRGQVRSHSRAARLLKTVGQFDAFVGPLLRLQQRQKNL
jgi:hypothetical protein